MSQPQVQRLQALLTRVQNNRKQPRRAATGGPQLSAAAPTREPARGAAPMRERPSLVEEPAQIPDRINMPQRPAAAAPARPAPAAAPPASAAAASPRASMAQEPARRPQRDRTATPLEMAVEGELNRPVAAAPAPAAPPAPAREQPAKAATKTPTSATERLMPAVRASDPQSNLEMPLTWEPEPVPEPARPIAQVASKHAPQLDATFGAMLKRSLSLRPQ